MTLKAKRHGKAVVNTEPVADEVPGTTIVETPVKVTVFKHRR